MPLILYGIEMSQPSRAIMMYLSLLGEDYQYKRIDLLKGEHMSDEYAKINPHKLVPAIHEDGFTLAESGAIMIYLAQTRKDNKFYSDDVKVAAKINSYILWHQTGLRPKTAPYFGCVYKALFPPGKITISKEAAEKNLEEGTQKFCDLFLKDSKFIVGDKMTIADLLAASEFQQVAYGTNYEFKKKFPAVVDWLERVFSEPLIKDTCKILSEFREKFKDIAQ